MSELTQSCLKKLLHYATDTGVFMWPSPLGRAKTHDVAGCLDGTGYRYIRIDGKRYSAHRLAWLYMTGAWPKDEIDHINGVCDDNRIANLREATRGQNQQNMKIYKNNTSGLMGVSWHKQRQKWRADIAIAGRSTYLGLFDTPEAAYEAYLLAKAGLHTFQPKPREEVMS